MRMRPVYRFLLLGLIVLLGVGGFVFAQNDTTTGRVWGPNLTLSGIAQFSRYISTVATGTAPFTVTSTTVVPNLHAATADSSASGTFSLGTGYLSETRVVTAALTTTAGLLIKTATTGNTVSTAALADVGVGGIAITSQTAGQNVEVAVKGVANCVADNTTVIGDILGVGTNTAGRCLDLGQTSSVTVAQGLQIIGKALSVATVGNNVLVQVYGQGLYGSGSPAGSNVSSTICSGTVVLGTGALTTGAKGNGSTSACSGLATTDAIINTSNAEIFTLTGFVPSASGILTVNCWPTANTVNCEEANNTAGTITPAAVTVNYRVVR